MASSYTHRKLLPLYNTTNIPTIQTCLYFCNPSKNETISNPGFCPPACLKICPSTCQYSFSTIFTPDNSTPQLNKTHNLSPLLISMLILLASTFLLITFYVLYTKFYKNIYQNNHTDNNSNPQTRQGWRGSSQVQVREADEEHENNYTMGFHPIWHIPTVGLNSATIKSIKITTFEKGIVECDCAVCLGEFVVGDDMRILPKCNHAFHVICIDTWFKSHVTCPLCRGPIDPPINKEIDQNCEISVTITPGNNNRGMENDNSPSEVVVIDANINTEDCFEDNKDEKLSENEESSSSQRWAASLVSRSLSCSGKFFSSRYNNRPGPN